MCGLIKLFILFLRVCTVLAPNASWEVCLQSYSYVLFLFSPPFVLKREQRFGHSRINCYFVIFFDFKFVKGEQPWPVQSRLPVSPLEEKLLVSSWPQRPLVRALHLLEESRSLIATGLALWPSVRSVVIRSPLSCSSGNCHSSAWSEKSPRTSRPTSASRALPSGLCRRPARLTWWVFLRTPTCVRSTPSV